MQNKNFLKTEVFKDCSPCITPMGVLFTLVMVMPIFASARTSLIFLSTLFRGSLHFHFPHLTFLLLWHKASHGQHSLRLGAHCGAGEGCPWDPPTIHLPSGSATAPTWACCPLCSNPASGLSLPVLASAALPEEMGKLCTCSVSRSSAAQALPVSHREGSVWEGRSRG